MTDSRVSLTTGNAEDHTASPTGGSEQSRPSTRARRVTGASVDITIPVLNEEHSIVNSLTTLSAFLDTECSYDWSITVADNGSSDRTLTSRLLCDEATGASRSSVSRSGGGVELSSMPGRPARRTWLRTWTWTCPRGSTPWPPSSIPSSKAVARSRSDHGFCRKPRSSAASSERRSRVPTTRSFGAFSTTKSSTPSAVSRRSARAWHASSFPRSRTTVGSSTPNCWFWRTGPACASTRSRCVGSRTPIHGCGSSRRPSTT